MLSLFRCYVHLNLFIKKYKLRNTERTQVTVTHSVYTFQRI